MQKRQHAWRLQVGGDGSVVSAESWGGFFTENETVYSESKNMEWMSNVCWLHRPRRVGWPVRPLRVNRTGVG